MRILYDNKQLMSLLDDFVNITGIRITVFDIEGKGIYSSPDQTGYFCQLAKQFNNIKDKCNKCDKKAFKRATETKVPYIYRCHLGLYEAIMPILHDDIIIGYIMIGQIAHEQSNNEYYDNLILQIDANEQQINDIYRASMELKVLDDSKMKSAVNLMHACSMYIYLQNIIDIESVPLAHRIRSYIESNYQLQQSSEDICDELNMGRTTVYKALKAEYNQSLTQLIQSIRLENACTMLRETNDKIMDIANKCGFSDYNYFSRVFKKTYEVTPRDYRELKK